MIRSCLRPFYHSFRRSQIHPCTVTLVRFQWNVAEEIGEAVPGAFRSPFALVENDLRDIPAAIGEELTIGDKKLEIASKYHFDQLGKLFRPTLVLLMAHLVNSQHGINGVLCEKMFRRQFKVAMIAEMIHTASLIHDDILDNSPVRRNEPTLHCSFGVKTAVLTGDFILSRASRLIASLNNCAVTEILALILEDLVVGELMQANGAEENNATNELNASVLDDTSIPQPNRRFFNHYLDRIYFKTASLMANSCKAVGVVSECSHDVVKATSEFGRLIGMSFQIMDDLLDVTSQVDSDALGKPAVADLHLGLATAPVLFASVEHPELVNLIQRRFSQDKDEETALVMIHQSSAVEQTRLLAAHYSSEAVKILNTTFIDSPYRTALATLANYVTERIK